MKETLIIAGFGGQGVLSMGKILAYSGVMQDYEVTWMPSYGPEMRGGTANVTVILSDKRISSPIAHEFDTAIVLNQQSMDKFESMVRPGGTLIYDTNGITRHPVRKDIEVYAIDATAECAKMGQAKLFNTMILGGYLKVRPVVAMENVMVGLKKSLPERAWKMLPANEEAIMHGGEIIRIFPPQECMVIRFDDRIATYTFDMLNELELAYAVTVHKSQGSEYPAVVLVSAPAAPSLMVRGVLYTAITRARRLLVLVGDDGTPVKMAANARQQRRYSGLRRRLKEGMA